MQSMEKNKTVVSATLGEILELSKEAANIADEVERTSPYIKALRSFFSVESGKLRKLSRTEYKYVWARLLLTFVPYMESLGYKVEKQENYDDDLGSGYFPGYDVIELAPG